MSTASTASTASTPVRTWTFRGSEDPVLRAQPSRIATSLTAHADQKARERVLLYGMVFALAPERCLEIGVRWGGGSRIIHAALADLGRGRLVSIDPMPALEFEWEEIADRATLIIGSSPDELVRARVVAEGDFDFVFIDGDHTEAACGRDLAGVLTVTGPGAVVLLHDAYHGPVARAIDAAVAGGGYTDCGMLAATRNDGVHVESGRAMTFGGVRMLRRSV
jgi:predicted O-methyltransferase YrrM